MGDEFDAEAVRGDIARIRERLRRLDAERQAAFEQLQAALREAERKLERLAPVEPARMDGR
jgi:hypothetical protein